MLSLQTCIQRVLGLRFLFDYTVNYFLSDHYIFCSRHGEAQSVSKSLSFENWQLFFVANQSAREGRGDIHINFNRNLL